MVEGLRPLTDRVGRDLARDAILEAHARHESSQQLQTPAMRYRDLLAVVHRRLAEEWGVPVRWGVCLRRGFQLPTSSAATVEPSMMSVRRDMPRHLTVLPGGGSRPRAR